MSILWRLTVTVYDSMRILCLDFILKARSLRFRDVADSDISKINAVSCLTCCLLLVCSVMMKWPTTKREVGETSKPGRAWARALARKVARGGWYGDN